LERFAAANEDAEKQDVLRDKSIQAYEHLVEAPMPQSFLGGISGLLRVVGYEKCVGLLRDLIRRSPKNLPLLILLVSDSAYVPGEDDFEIHQTILAAHPVFKLSLDWMNEFGLSHPKEALEAFLRAILFVTNSPLETGCSICKQPNCSCQESLWAYVFALLPNETPNLMLWDIFTADQFDHVLSIDSFSPSKRSVYMWWVEQ
jgi:hypothetical protein